MNECVCFMFRRGEPTCGVDWNDNATGAVVGNNENTSGRANINVKVIM